MLNELRTRLGRIGVGIVMVSGLTLAIVGCPGTTETTGGADTGGGVDAGDGADPDGPTGSKLFTLITETDPYEAWTQFPGAEGIVSSNPPHAAQTEIRINDLVAAALTNFDGVLPDGSIIVKRNIGEAGEKTDALNVMWKVSGFNPDDNDWFWANISEDGTVVAEGSLAGCIACHSGARANDFVFRHTFTNGG